MADEKNFTDELREKAAEAAETVNETVKETYSDAVEEVTEAVSEVADAAQDKIEDAKDAVSELAESAADSAEAAKDAVLEGADGVTEPMSEVERAVAEAMAARDADELAAKAQKSGAVKVIAIIAAIVIVIGGAVLSGFVSKDSAGGWQINTYDGWLSKLCNKYNHMGFVDSTGNTLGDITEQLGIEMPDFLETYGLPADMPKSTYEMVALYMMPAKNYAENICGIDFETLKGIVKIPDTAEDGTELTEDTEWYIVEGEIRVGDYINGDENLEEFKETFEITDDSITADTKWKDVRNMVDEYQKKQRIESQKATETSEDDVVDTDDVAETEETDETADAADAAAETADSSTAE